jgi:KaiC/GvpD/RAD55 family RecA-like ATPase
MTAPGYVALVQARAAEVRQQQETDAQQAQVDDTLLTLTRTPEDFLRWPWPKVQEVLGGLAPSDIAFLVGHRGGGKTSFLLSLVLRLITKGRKVYYAGLESRPAWLRTQLACRALGLDPGPVLSGDYLKRPDAEDLRARLRHEVLEQKGNPIYQRLRFAQAEFLGAQTLDRITKTAADWGADLLIIDHIDHVQPETTGDTYGESRAINLLLKKAADATGLRVLAASQTNLTGLSADLWRNHRPIRDEHVFMGGHKGHIASVMIGVYRPMRTDVGKEQREAVREGAVPKDTCLQAGTVAVNVMKSRNYGGREGSIIELGFHHGEVTDAPDPALRREQTLGLAPEQVSGRRRKGPLVLMDGTDG